MAKKSETILDVVRSASSAEKYSQDAWDKYGPWMYLSVPDSVLNKYDEMEEDVRYKAIKALRNPSPTKNLKEEKSILEVFGEKSKDADTAINYGMGLSQAELLDIAMSVTPMGGVKAGKGAISFLKGLLGRAKSKAKFPVGYSEPTRNIAKGKAELSEFFELKKLNEALKRLSNPEKYSKLQTLPWGKEFKAGKELSGRMELQKSLSKGRQVNPLTKQEYNEIIKGMRKIGIKVKD